MKRKFEEFTQEDAKNRASLTNENDLAKVTIKPKVSYALEFFEKSR